MRDRHLAVYKHAFCLVGPGKQESGQDSLSQPLVSLPSADDVVSTPSTGSDMVWLATWDAFQVTLAFPCNLIATIVLRTSLYYTVNTNVLDLLPAVVNKAVSTVISYMHGRANKVGRGDQCNHLRSTETDTRRKRALQLPTSVHDSFIPRPRYYYMTTCNYSPTTKGIAGRLLLRIRGSP